MSDKLVAATEDTPTSMHPLQWFKVPSTAPRLFECPLQLVVLRALLQSIIQFLTSLIGRIVLINHFL